MTRFEKLAARLRAADECRRLATALRGDWLTWEAVEKLAPRLEAEVKAAVAEFLEPASPCYIVFASDGAKQYDSPDALRADFKSTSDRNLDTLMGLPIGTIAIAMDRDGKPSGVSVLVADPDWLV